MKKLLLILGAIVVLGGIVAASILSGDRQRGAEVYVETVTPRDLTHVVTSSGQIHPRNKVNLSAHVVGKIEKLYVEEGESIGAGEPFLELEKDAYIAVRDNARAQLAIERSRLRQAEIELADAELQLGRARRLAETGISSAEAVEAAAIRLERAELERNRAQEGILQARASLDKAEDDLNKTTIFSPIAGRIIELQAEEGEVVVSGTMNMPGSIIGVVADLSEILAEVDVDETEIVDIELGQRARVLIDALPDTVVEGEVIKIGSSGFQRPQQPDVIFFKVEILLDDPDERLRPGMSTRAEVQVATHEDALAVPIQAVVLREPVDGEDAPSSEDATSPGDDNGEIEVVFVVEDGEAVQTPVVTGLADATHVEIESGLAAEQSIVTGPYRELRKLRHGDPVEPRSEAEEAAKEAAEGAEDEERED